MTDATDGLEDFTGDERSAQVLRNSLRALAQQAAGTPLGDEVQDVLAGRRHIRELANNEEFAQLTTDGMHAFEESWAQLSPAEREQQLREGEAYLAGDE